MGDLETQYDVFVSGSDQIWNMDAWDYSDAYFLSFDHHKPKVSYASSVWAVIFLTNVEIRHLLAIIEHYWLITRPLHEREKTAQDYLQPLLDKPVTQVIDPTLLLERKDYEEISRSSAGQRNRISSTTRLTP
ncbi:MAG: hypothetical protein ACLUA4_01550 [Bifidobacterium sp.]